MGTDQIANGFILMGLGMGVVFVFLVLLIFTTKLMSRICGRLGASGKKASDGAAVANVQAQGSGEAEVAIAIAAAVRESKK
ncbi:MAG: OadG family protein [Sphaerochaetaceae bacterium]|jgi:oxaloacetate decarboxylase (Na+ extruding) subunit gamma|nr:OadG family protein [Sphaerochaetaceae bacterium]NLY07977.1 OadG family protein [Spirochaetales bacterium]